MSKDKKQETKKEQKLPVCENCGYEGEYDTQTGPAKCSACHWPVVPVE